MTFFANSGIRFPGQESQTKSAGEKVLRGGSELFKMIGELERGVLFSTELDKFRSIGASFKAAAKVYARVASALPDERIEIGLDDHYFAQTEDGDHHRRRVRPRELYFDLARLLEILGRDVDIFLSTVEMAEHGSDVFVEMRMLSVFRLMRQLERISVLSRLIATVNRRVIK